MNIEDNIIDAINGGGVQKPAIILNGRYLMVGGRRVYVEVVDSSRDDSSHLRYFVRQYNSSSKRSDEQTLAGQTVRIKDELSNNQLFGVFINSKQDLQYMRASVNAEYDVLILESQLYQIGEKLQESKNVGELSVGTLKMSAMEALAIKRVFQEKSLVNYRDVVYGTSTNRFAKHLVARNKLYGLRPNAFVPVFIDVEWLYNPLKNHDLGVEATKMHKMAVEKGRMVRANEVTAYFMTHKEICEAFGMTRFARFSPSLWYNIFIGLLQPSNAAFPNKSTRVVQWTGEQQPPAPLKRQYSIQEFQKMMETMKSEYSGELEMYGVVESLDAYIEKEVNAIKTIGPTYMDSRDKASLAKLQEYYREATLLY